MSKQHVDFTTSQRRTPDKTHKSTVHNHFAPTPKHICHLPQQTDEWPINSLHVINEILHKPSMTPTPSRFKFETTEAAAEHNWLILSQSDHNLGRAITHDGTSPLKYGSEFRPSSTLEPLFHLHPLWPRLKKILDEGINYPLSPLSTALR